MVSCTDPDKLTELYCVRVLQENCYCAQYKVRNDKESGAVMIVRLFFKVPNSSYPSKK